MVEVAQAGNQFAVNDSALSNVRQTIDEISTRIDVAEKLVQCFDEAGSIQVNEDSAPADLVDQISNYFDRDKTADDVAHVADNHL
jgi:hypothetical protein